MKWLYLILSIIVLTISNIFKINRISQFIEPYEKPNNKLLGESLAVGNLLNIFLPFRLGYVFRAHMSGKKMKNGSSFSLATIFIEIFLDFIFVPIIFLIFYLFKYKSQKSILFYIITLFIMCIMIILLKKLKKYVKILIYKFASIFNEHIELKILKTSWFTIISFENIITRVSKLRLLLNSIIIWCMNILSCYLLSLTLQFSNLKENLFGLFNFFYSESGIISPIIFSYLKLDKNYMIIIFLYYLGSILLLYFSSFIINKQKYKNKYVEILPHVNMHDRLNFLEQYFNNNSDYFKNYIKLNSDVSILEDYSAGSNATTMLCSKEGNLFYRKYSLGKDAEKLKAQIEWLENHEDKITLTRVMNVHYENNCCSYDMPYIDGAVTCFNYVHTTTSKNAWKILKQALDDISKNLHTINRRKSSEELIKKYIETKVLNNIEKIENCQYIKPLLKYDYVNINGKKIHNLTYFKKYLNYEYLYDLFINDMYSDIHGDFTIENIICLKDKKNKGKNYYIIDPNTGNVHDSPYLDYAKLLQSIHGGYEFLMKTKTVEVKNNTIDFLFTKSDTYNMLFKELKKYINKKFGEIGEKSIFYHEAIHWLRLMPYKIEKNGERCIIFYAGLLLVLNDVEEMFEKKKVNNE